MTWPGEGLIIRMWETLADNGIGGLLRPWQERRVGNAQSEVRANEIVLLAKAQAEANQIASRNIRVDSKTNELVKLGFENGSPDELSDTEVIPQSPPSVLDEFDADMISDIVERRDLACLIRKEVNVSRAALFAEDILANSETTTPSARIDQDWLFRWKEYAGQVSSDELSELWGRVLAGEISAPGSNSLRLMEFLKTLSRDDAEKIEKIVAFEFCNIIARNQLEFLDSNGLQLAVLLELQEIGIVSSADSIGLKTTYNSSVPDRYLRLLPYKDYAVLVEHNDASKVLAIPCINITSLGQQIISLCSPSENIEYMELIAKDIVKQGFKVRVGNWEMLDSINGRLTNSRAVEA